jgi:hypothetical protein
VSNRQRIARLVEPFATTYPTDEQIATMVCEIADIIDRKPGDPGSAYSLPERVRAILEEYADLEDELRGRHR